MPSAFDDLLRERLREHGFNATLSKDSGELVSNLLDELILAKDDNRHLRSLATEHSAHLLVAEQVAPPLRTELAHVVRENTALRSELIAMSDRTAAAAAAAPAADETSNVIRDLKFVSSSLRHRVRSLEAENAALREAASRSFEANGVVLPSGHEVRWHGWKERMEAHTPVPPLPAASAAALAIPGTMAMMEHDGAAAEEGLRDDDAARLVPAAEPVRLIRAAEGQLSTMLHRIHALESHASRVEAELADATAKLATRDAELGRLSARLVASVEKGSVLAAPAAPPAAPAAIGQLNAQVDFLNERCVMLEAALQAEAAAAREARSQLREATMHLEARNELMGDRAKLQEELRYAAAVAAALDHNSGA